MTGVPEQFQEFRRILCVCPCCGDIVRVSDLKLFARDPGPKTWLDSFEESERRVELAEERFYDQEEHLREASRQKGRDRAEVAFSRCISPQFRKMGLDPFDMKPILNPVDFVVFSGMNKGDDIREVLFLSKVSRNPVTNTLRKHVKSAVDQGKYEWRVARIGPNGDIGYE